MDPGVLSGLAGGLGGIVAGLDYRRQNKRQAKFDDMEQQRFEQAMAAANLDLEQGRWKHNQDVEMSTRLRQPIGEMFQGGLESVPADMLPQYQDYTGLGRAQTEDTRTADAWAHQQRQWGMEDSPIPASVSSRVPGTEGMTQGQFGMYGPMLNQIQDRQSQNQLQQPPMQEPWSYENRLRMYQTQAGIRGDLMKEGLGLMIQQDPQLMEAIQRAEMQNLGNPLTHDQIFRMMTPEQQASVQQYADSASDFYWQQTMDPYSGGVGQSNDYGADPAAPQPQGQPMQQGPMTPGQYERMMVQEGQSQMPPSMGTALQQMPIGQAPMPSVSGGGMLPGYEAFARDWRPGTPPQQIFESMLAQSGQLDQGSRPLPIQRPQDYQFNVFGGKYLPAERRKKGKGK